MSFQHNITARRSTQDPIRVVLADDHTLVRTGIRTLLQSIPNVQVMAEARDGCEVVQQIDQYRPDVAFIDVAMPGLNGLEATSRIVARLPRVRVVVLSMESSEEAVLRALRAGVVGYLLKGARLAEFELALNAVMRGEIYLCPAAATYVVNEYLRAFGSQGASTREAHGSSASLTSRQREILQLLADGYTTGEIAHQLNLSGNTIESHQVQLMEHLRVCDITELVRYAIRAGLVQPEI